MACSSRRRTWSNKLYGEHLGKDRLAIEVDGPTFDTSREGRRVPVLDAVASRSADGNACSSRP